MSPEMPLRKVRLAIGMTTTEAGQYANVTRKTWESWEAAEVAGEPAPKSAVELVYAKLERICDVPKFRAPNGMPREIVVIFKVMDQATGEQLPIDAVAADNFLGLAPGPDGSTVIKSMAVAWRTGRPYLHKTIYLAEDNPHVERFVQRHLAIV